jgi:hypothetical protein
MKQLKEKASSWFSNLELRDFQNYSKIIKLCVDNEARTLLEIYKELENQMKLASYISAVYNLHQKSLLDLDILKFSTLA